MRNAKVLSQVLRHAPRMYALQMDAGGWVACAQLCAHTGITPDSLARIVDDDPKRRFAFNADRTRVRAQYGHTMPALSLGYRATKPPDTLYHGTTQVRAREIFASSGLLPQRRQYVHLTARYADAVSVNTRYAGETCVLTIDALGMYREGYALMRAGDSDVWLTAGVPRKYLAEAPCAL